MATVELGTTFTASWALGTADETVTLTVTRPDGDELAGVGTVTAGTPTTTYEATVPSPIAGRYLLSWEKAAEPAKTYTDVLDVWPADPFMIVSLADARRNLSLLSTDTKDDEELRLFIAAATAPIEDIVGPVVARPITQVADGGKTGVALYEPATSIVSVTVDGTALVEGTEYVFNQDASIVYAGSAKGPSFFPDGRQNVAIVYRTGREIIPANVRLGTLELIRHLWTIGHQMTRPRANIQAATDMSYTPSGFAVPKRVIELCEPNMRVDGFG